MKKIFILSIFFIILFSSCASRKDFVYFQSIDSIETYQTPKSSMNLLRVGDILTISVGADDVRATQPFNPMSSYAAGSLQNTNPYIPTYTIDSQGNINFPKLGEIKLAGKTRVEAIKFITTEVSKFIVNPSVTMEVRNFKITVLGEVKNPGIFSIENDRISLLEALGLAGDLTINGVRKNVLVIRENENLKEEYRIDLTSMDILNSPVYYLRQNDVVYIEPNKAKIQSSRYTQNTSVWVSIASLIIGLTTLIIK